MEERSAELEVSKVASFAPSESNHGDGLGAQSRGAREVTGVLTGGSRVPAAVAPPPPGLRATMRATMRAHAAAVIQRMRPSLDYLRSLHARVSHHGSDAADQFLQSNPLYRILLLFPALHPWCRMMHYSLVRPYSSRVAQYIMKILSAGAIGALFFSTSAATPDSDPECSQSPELAARFARTATVGFVSTMLGDVHLGGTWMVEI